MSIQQISILHSSRRVNVAMWSAALFLLIATSSFFVFESLMDSLVSMPNYQKVFAMELAQKYNQVTGVPTIVVRNSWSDIDENQVVSGLKARAAALLESDKRFLAKNMPSRTITRPIPKVLEARVTYYPDAPDKLSLMEFVDMKLVGDFGMEIKSLLENKQPEQVFGQLPNNQSLSADRVTIFDLTKAQLNLEQLNWRSEELPFFGLFNENFKNGVILRGLRVDNFVDEVMVRRMSNKVAQNFYRTRSLMRWIWFFSCLFFGYSSLSLFAWYDYFLRKYNLRLFPPGLLRSAFAWDIVALAKRRKTLILNMKLEELKARAKKKIPQLKLDLSAFSLAKEDPVFPTAEDYRLAKTKKVDDLVDDFRGFCNGSETDSQAWGLYEQALATDDRRQQRNLLTKAITLQKQHSNKAKQVASSPEPKVETKTPAEYVEITLSTELERLFPEPDFLPEGVNGRMAREIIVELRDIFGSNYKPYDTVRAGVVKSYTKLQKKMDAKQLRFQPAIFESTLRWLVKQNVLNTYHKSDQLMYRLTGDPDDGRCEEARRLIRTAKCIKDYLKVAGI